MKMFKKKLFRGHQNIFWTAAFKWRESDETVSVSRSLCQCARMSVGRKVTYQFFSVIAHRIFLELYKKLEGLKGQKLTELNFSEKLSFLGKSPKVHPK